MPSEPAPSAEVKRALTVDQVRDAAERAGVHIPESMLACVAAAYNALLPGIARLEAMELGDTSPAAVTHLEP